MLRYLNMESTRNWKFKPQYLFSPRAKYFIIYFLNFSHVYACGFLISNFWSTSRSKIVGLIDNFLWVRSIIFDFLNGFFLWYSIHIGKASEYNFFTIQGFYRKKCLLVKNFQTCVPFLAYTYTTEHIIFDLSTFCRKGSKIDLIRFFGIYITNSKGKDCFWLFEAAMGQFFNY